MEIYKFLTLLLFVLIIGCSQPEQLLYDTSYPLTSEKAYSAGTSLNVKIPQGWFTAEDNDSHLIDLWLIEDNFISQIAFKLISVNNFESGLSLRELTSYVKKQKIAEIGNGFKDIIPDERFFINAIEFYSYQYLDKNGLPARVVIFNLNKKFYECTAAFSSKANKDKASPSVLFKIQNSVLSSISLK